MTEHEAPKPEAPLESWKEIAAYLNRDARTVRRWEQSEGLPVHRHRHRARSSVYAYPSELDAWRAGRKPEGRTGAAAGIPVRTLRLVAAAVLGLSTLLSAGGGRFVGPALSAQAGEPAARRVWTLPPFSLFGVVSPDERRFAFVTSDSTLDVHDLASGATTTVVPATRGVSGEPAFPAFSRDSRQLAFTWFERGRPAVIRIAPVEPGATPRDVYSQPDVREPYAFDWTPDGRLLACMLVHRDRTIQIALISTENGSARVLKSMEWRTVGHMQLSPDGRYLAYDLPASTETSARDVYVLAVDGSGEHAVATGPGREVFTGWSPDGSRVIFESDRGRTSALWAVPVTDGKASGAPVRLLATAGRFSPAGVSSAGRVYYRLRDSPRSVIRTAVIDFDNDRIVTPPIDVPGGPRGFTTHTPTISPDGGLVAHFTEDHGYAGQLVTRTTRVTIRDLETGQVARELKPDPELEYVTALSWSPDGRQFTLAGRNLRGRTGIYLMDAVTGVVSTIALAPPGSGRAQAPAWSSDGRTLYYSWREGRRGEDQRRIVAFDLSTRQTRTLYARDDFTAMKISPDGRHIAAATSQNRVPEGGHGLVIVSTADGRAREVLPAGGEVVSLVGWWPDGRSVIARKAPRPNVREAEFWRVQIDGSESTRLRSELSYPFQLHPNGRHVVFEIMENRNRPNPEELWVLENLLTAPVR